MILYKIVASKKKYLEKVKQQVPLSDIKNKLSKNNQAVRSFSEALSNKKHMAVIAEIKKASPSKGIISEKFNPMEIARQYFEVPVDAISVLTETEHFLGSPDYLKDISRESRIPLLRKDFIIDEYQIYESKLLGADAILLIASLLDEKTLKEFYEIASELNIDCLFEAHNEDEIKKIEAAGGRIIGINNRDLKTFKQDIQTTIRLLPFIPKGKLVVSESAIKTPENIKLLKEAGVSAVLIGETFMKSDNIKKTAEFLKGGGYL